MKKRTKKKRRISFLSDLIVSRLKDIENNKIKTHYYQIHLASCIVLTKGTERSKQFDLIQTS